MLSTSYYRAWVGDHDLCPFSVTFKQTDLFIRAQHDLSREVLLALRDLYADLEGYISKHPLFLSSLTPIDVLPASPVVVQRMAEASRPWQVGPMATVSGAIAELIGSEMLSLSSELVVENGGDIYLYSPHEMKVAIYAGCSPLSGRLGIRLNPVNGLGVCTSSGTVGHSLSFGVADAVTVVAPSAALADAAATAIGNLVVSPSSFERALDMAQRVGGISGVVIIKDNRIGAWGEVELCAL